MHSFEFRVKHTGLFQTTWEPNVSSQSYYGQNKLLENHEKKPSQENAEYQKIIAQHNKRTLKEINKKEM